LEYLLKALFLFYIADRKYIWTPLLAVERPWDALLYIYYSIKWMAESQAPNILDTSYFCVDVVGCGGKWMTAKAVVEDVDKETFHQESS
jgi:hypothetical protein